MTLGLIVAIAATGIVLGTAVGAVGIGGMLLVPFLTLALGIDVKHAIAAAMKPSASAPNPATLDEALRRGQEKTAP